MIVKSNSKNNNNSQTTIYMLDNHLPPVWEHLYNNINDIAEQKQEQQQQTKTTIYLLDNHLSILKSLGLKSIRYYQSLPLVQTFWKQVETKVYQIISVDVNSRYQFCQTKGRWLLTQNLHLGQMALIGCPFSYRGTHQDFPVRLPGHQVYSICLW